MCELRVLRCVNCDGTEYVEPFPTLAGKGVCAFCSFDAPVGHCEECRRPIGSDLPFSILVGEHRFHRPCLRQTLTRSRRDGWEHLAEIPPTIDLGEQERQRMRDQYQWEIEATDALRAVGYPIARAS